MPTRTSPEDAPSHEQSPGEELRKEGSTMALYVAVCLLAGLMAVPDAVGHHGVRVIGIVWGTTIGLTLAHLFAFRLSSRLVSHGRVDPHDVRVGAAQLAGATLVAMICTVPILFLSETAELDAVRLLLAAFVAVVGYEVASSNGGSRGRSLLYAGAVMVMALTIAITKNILGGH
ncbi:MAG: hypothetical protein R2754_02030 [Microthrixaceae bacterium]